MTSLPAEIVRWKTSPLTSEHLTEFVQSGRAEIDAWLSQQALRLQNDAVCRTFVWADQPPYVGGFFALVPHSIQSDEDAKVSGHAGGALSGYLIAKIGIHHTAAFEESALPGESSITLQNRYLLLIDAVVMASRASYYGGGRYVFIDLQNEPEYIVEVARRIGFNPMTPTGGTMHIMKVRRRSQGASDPTG